MCPLNDGIDIDGNFQDIDGIYDPVEIAIQKYSSHPSVKLISSNTKPSHSFAFNFVANSRVSAELRDLKVRKPLLLTVSQVKF